MHPSASSPPHTDPTAAVESVLTAELARRRAEVVAIDHRLDGDVDRLIGYISAGGKRLRPQFLCWGFLAAHPEAERFTAGDRLPPGVLQAAAALELIQACALIHDDIIDRSDTRRGKPSIHRSVQKLHADHGWSGDAEHYGLSSALLLGDLALAWADDLFLDGFEQLGGPAGALSAWRAMRTEVLAGQLLDLRITADRSGDPEVAADDAMVVNRYKTAAYTVERPLHLGAALGGASPATVTALREYGAVIGVGFQLRDDLLGVFGDPAATGKPAGGDLIEGKRTVLLAMARAALRDRPELLAELDAGIGSDLLPAQVDRLTDLVAATTAPAEIETRISSLFDAGTRALAGRDEQGVPVVHPIAADNLLRLARAATVRDR
ncbi:geranylgeranyl diphosphate synthase, type I [Nakamurella panacisegetis]|uniref:Geranylgeranyl diphosphate synthase, type I n=1 Tax=Nakamurella panacisegetis TaxID=1090615 RepID=A0A1H0R3A9_9ACTN|nr:polyprenyl synthetase family protein [Nakamurella panacisegetis]SDP24014.1 geranylgeranyl diphosphate synthase, type I [Nakamurella panacisegetis]